MVAFGMAAPSVTAARLRIKAIGTPKFNATGLATGKSIRSFEPVVGEYSGFGNISCAQRTVRTLFAAFAVTAYEKKEEVAGYVVAC